MDQNIISDKEPQHPSAAAHDWFSYRAHGLSLLSRIEIPEARLADHAEPDVTIRYGDVPSLLEEFGAEGAGHQVGLGVLRLAVPGVCDYCLRGGRDLVIAPAPGVSPAAVRGPLLSSVLGGAVHERGDFALHASAVAIDGHSVLFTGVSGAGKSTLAAACHSAGHPMLSDDLVAVELPRSGRPLAHPGYHVLKLRADALERFGWSFGAAHPLEGWPGKFIVRIPGPFVAAPLPVRAVFDLGEPAPDLSSEEVTGVYKSQVLLQRLYRRRMVPALGHAQRTLVSAAAIARVVPIWRLRVPRSLDALPRAIAEIRRVVGQVST